MIRRLNDRQPQKRDHLLRQRLDTHVYLIVYQMRTVICSLIYTTRKDRRLSKTKKNRNVLVFKLLPIQPLLISLYKTNNPLSCKIL